MFTFGYLFSRMSWLNKCFHRYFSQYLSLYEVFNVHSLRKAKPLEVSSKLLYQSTFISNAFGSGQLHSFMFLTEWRWRDSNSWPPACKAGALPTELHPHLDFYSIQRLSPMGLSGLEPPTSRLSGVRSNQLSYKPILKFGCSLPVVSERLKNIFVHFQWTHYFYSLAATYSPVPSPVKYHRPLRS